MASGDTRLTHLELEAIGADLVHKLGGYWSHGRGMCLCPVHPDGSPSLSVRVGHTNLLFHCFAGCETAAILRWIRNAAPKALGGAEAAAPAARHTEAWLRSRARDLWDEAFPIAGTPAQAHLRSRAIDGDAEALRYHPRTPLGPGRNAVRRPAMLACVRDDDRVVAVQRTFLDPKLNHVAKDLPNARMLLGRPCAGAVRLSEPQGTLGLAEGVETALSASRLLGISVWAVLGNERFSQITLPRGLSRLILLPDNDRPGRRGASAAIDHYRGGSLAVELTLPWDGLNDWNDVLRHRRAGEKRMVEPKYA